MTRLRARVIRLEQAGHHGGLSEKEAEALLLDALRVAHRGMVVEDPADDLASMLVGTKAGAFLAALGAAGRSLPEETLP
ncbi:MAG TPA: hypothetical protein VNL71_24315 [Chloroflexota bacterium]|nr:hypothetical protein [Chloroflexota bacterium]